MTLIEALRELDLPNDYTKASVRSAYLKLLKVRKPEKDPEGFARLREAYELLDGHLKAVPVGPPTPAMAPTVQLAETVPVPVPQPIPVPAPPPNEASPNEVQKRRWTEVLNAMGAGRWSEASAALATALAGAIELPEAPALLPVVVFNILLDLQRNGEAEGPLKCWLQFVQWVRLIGGELRLSSEAGATLHLAQELCLLPARFPVALRKIIAASLLRRSFEEAIPELKAFSSANPAEAEQAFYMLVDRAPLTHSIIGQHISAAVPTTPPPEDDRNLRTRPMSNAAVISVLVGSVAAVLLLFIFGGDIWKLLPSEAGGPGPDVALAAAAKPVGGDSNELTRRICQVTQNSVASQICSNAMTISAQLSRGECAGVPDMVRRLKVSSSSISALSTDVKDGLNDDVFQLIAAADVRCQGVK